MVCHTLHVLNCNSSAIHKKTHFFAGKITDVLFLRLAGGRGRSVYVLRRGMIRGIHVFLSVCSDKLVWLCPRHTGVTRNLVAWTANLTFGKGQGGTQ